MNSVCNDVDGNPLRAAFVLAVVVFLLGIASQCSACDDTGRTARADGTWSLTDDYFRCLLSEVKLARLSSENLKAQVGTLESLRALDEETIGRYKAHVTLEERATERAHEALTLHREAAIDADAWHRSPVLWFVVGVASTSLAVVAIGSSTK